jgi:hypothetical protein
MSFLSKLFAGTGKELLDGVGGIISKFKADPTKVVEIEAELEKLKISHEQKLAEINAELQKSEDQAVTDRWKADMASDSWLSKNVRPMAFGLTLIFMYFIVVFDSIEAPWCNQFQVSEGYKTLIENLLMTLVIAYFGSRGAEKVVSKLSKKK